MKNDLYAESYGAWAGNPKGLAPDYTRCCKRISGNGRGVLVKQCRRKRGHGPDQAYCKQHDPEVINARQHAQHEKMRAEALARNRSHPLYKILKQIADGHNDPRTLAAEAIKGFEG